MVKTELKVAAPRFTLDGRVAVVTIDSGFQSRPSTALSGPWHNPL